MAKKNFKGGLDSLIENSLGIKKSRKGEMKGNPVDLIKPEQTDDNDEVLAKPRTPQKPAAPAQNAAADNNQTSETKTTDNKTTDNNVSAANQTATAAPKTPAVTPKDNTAKAIEASDAPSFEDTPDDYDDDDNDDNIAVSPSMPKQVVTMNLDATDDDDAKIAYLKEVIADLRHELFLWRNGTINVQSFNATLHTHGLKYNPENNEIEEFDTI